MVCDFRIVVWCRGLPSKLHPCHGKLSYHFLEEPYHFGVFSACTEHHCWLNWPCWLINVDMAPNSPAGLEVLAPAQGGEPQGCMDSKIMEASLCYTLGWFFFRVWWFNFVPIVLWIFQYPALVLQPHSWECCWWMWLTWLYQLQVVDELHQNCSLHVT